MSGAKPAITIPRLLDAEPEVSYSAWKRWKECNFQEALLRMGPTYVPRATKDRRNYLVGNVVHRLLREHVVAYRLPVEAQQIKDTFEYEAAKPGMRFKSTSDRPILFERAVNTMNALTPPLLSLLTHATKVSCELDVKHRFPMPLEGDGHFWMQGVLDLVATLHDGRVVVLDFKSSRAFDRAQLVWYAALSAQLLDSPTFAFLSPGPNGAGYKLDALQTTQEEMLGMILQASVMARALKLGIFTSNPSFYRCSQCRVRGSCADSAYHTNRGRPDVH
jgi:hypothetical protein